MKLISFTTSPLINVAPLLTKSLASLFDWAALTNTNASTILISSFVSSCFNPLKQASISANDNSLMFPLNNASLICTACSYSASPCKSVITALANALCGFLKCGSLAKETSNSSISSLGKNVNFFK